MRALLRVLPLMLLASALLPANASSAEPARVLTDVNYNLDEVGPHEAWQNSLDLYLPAESDQGPGLRPVVVWVHGGGWATGDKKNRMTDKARLFNDLGYVVASVNYRLSPSEAPPAGQGFDPGRVRAPNHITDVAEAITWLSRNVAGYGGDPDRLVLIGHSAGAHLVSLAGTDPVWLRARWVSMSQVLGVVSLDTDTFDVRKEADPANPLNSASRLALIWNAFGTPEEEAADPQWEAASPLASADPGDPPFLLVTQSDKVLRMASNTEMATALGENPAEAVVGVPLDHEGINTALGSPSDTTVETARVSQFVQGVVASAQPAGLKITRRPARRVVLRIPKRMRKAKARKATRRVVVAFKGTGRTARFQCRVDRRAFFPCRSPRAWRLKRGAHTVRVRALYPSGQPGAERTVKLRVVPRRLKK